MEGDDRRNGGEAHLETRARQRFGPERQHDDGTNGHQPERERVPAKGDATLAGRNSTFWTLASKLVTTGLPSRSSATQVLRHQMRAQPATSASDPCCSDRATLVLPRASPPAATPSATDRNASHWWGPGSHSHPAMPAPNKTANHKGSCPRSRSSVASARAESAEILAGKKRSCASSSGASSMLGALVQSIGSLRQEESAPRRKPEKMTSASSKITGVVTRFAPSPTGYLHIGGARTALFNWLFARHHGGKYLLRIEDTDRARSTKEAIDAILDGLDWLGISGDGEPYFQSQFEKRHAEVAHDLIARGSAYRCFLTPEELQARREKAQAERRPFRIESEWRDRTDWREGEPYVVRIKAPREGETVIDDMVQGQVTVANAEIDDFVLLRSDGTPTYMLAVVVDDFDMGVTHIIRGDDHLNNAFRQLAIIRAMDWPVPVYAHVPLIHGHDGAKLSKRHGALGVDAYRDELGILPEALFNYLLRLGWGHGDDEIISREQAVDWFDLNHVGKSPSRFDTKKLENLNGHYIREADDARLASLVSPKYGLSYEELPQLIRAMPELKARAHNINELAEGAAFLFAERPLPIDEKAGALLTDEARGHLRLAHDALAAAANWDHDTLDAAVREVAERNALKLGKLAQPLRAALTGKTTSPGIFDVLVLLGKDESLARIADQILEPNA